MKHYRIHKELRGGIKAVKHGWSWTAFFFNWGWAFLKGLHGLGAVIIIGFAVFAVWCAGDCTAGTLLILCGLGVSLWLGMTGNELWENNLKNAGYEFVQTINAKSADEAVILFLIEQDKKRITEKT